MHYSFLFAKRVSLVIGAAYILTPVALSADPSALLERWPMDEQTGNVISGVVHALNGTLVNGPQWTRSCLGSGALSFDGQNDYAELGTPTELLDLPQSSFSIVMWIKTMDLATRSILIGNYDGDPAWNLEIHTSDQPGHLRLYLDGEDHHDDVSVADGQWHHIAAVRDLDAGQVTLYIDGQIAYSQASAKGAFSVPAGRPTRLARDSRADLSYEGWMDDVRLYTAALTQDDVFNIIEEAIQDSPLGTYTFPAIPPKTVWHGSTYSFLVQWPDHEGALFDLWATPQPTGQLSLERVLHTDTWMVSYTPDQSDVLPFEVILGGYGFETVKQSFELLPMAHLAPEQEVFDISNHTGPGPFGSEEVVEHVSNGIVANINYQGNKQLKRVELIGKTILWEDTPAADDLFDFYNGKLDQESITLTAETVIIRSALHFPQTNVTIHARQLRFEGASAQIKTTPIDNPVSYPGDQNPGSDGRSAGNIELNINTFYTSHNGIKFALNGSRGQDGGRGHDGDPGRSVSTYWTTFNFNDSGIQFNWTAPSGEYIIFKEAWNRCAFGIPILAFRRPADGAPAIPTNGHNAVSSGKPGKGGAAGHLKTTLP
ncbi:MAG: LamG domain-containing protein, partial [Sedimentisphaerales bacterium]|nr:LamG domain-containing protein [Sedimentisphaerales bacterium]